MLKTLTNKHLIVAMIVAPIIAVIAYFGVDSIVSEKPHKAVKGNYYPLAAKSNCRYQSGQCTLKNGDISITITLEPSNNNRIDFAVSANQSVQNIHIALADEAKPSSPASMRVTNAEQTEWELSLPGKLSESSRLQIALAVNETMYFGETGTDFSEYQTGYTLNQ